MNGIDIFVIGGTVSGMPQPEPPLTIAQVKEFESGRPVPVIVGTLAAIFEHKSGVGKYESTVQNAILKDAAGDEIRINIWNQQDYSSRKGATVRICAAFVKGRASTTTKLNTFKTPHSVELEMSKDTVFLFAGSSTNEPAQDSPPPKQTASAPTPAAEQLQSAAGYPAAWAGKVINGATVGASLKLALDVVWNGFVPTSDNASKEAEWWAYVDYPEFSQRVWRVASDLIRVAQMLESGKLAPSPKERHAPPASAYEPEPPPLGRPRAADRPRPGHDGSVAFNEEPFDPGF